MHRLRAVGRVVAAVSLVAAGAVAGAGSAAADQTLTASPLQVTFVQAEFATHYKVDASDSAGLPITYAWTLTPPTVDPACNNYGNLTSSSNEFIWRHGDQDHCDHTKQGALGHLGIVSVVVSDASSRCSGSYGGTEGANGSPTASVPLTCTAVAGAPPLTASTAGTSSSTATPTAAVPSSAASATSTAVHTSSGGGLQWLVVVLIAVGLLGLGLVGWRWRRGHGTEQDFVYPDYSPGAGDDAVERPPLEPPVLPTLVGSLTPPVVGVVTTDDPLDTDDDDTDCSQLRARCAQLSAEAAQARANAAQAQATSAAAAAELATATAALTAAQRAAAAADHPDPGESWMEDAETGERVTEHDLMLQRTDEAATGEIHLDDPAHRAQLRQQERDRAHQALTAAQSNERAAHGRADQASAAAAAAQAAAATVQAEANAACAAADECDKAATAVPTAAAAAPTPAPTTLTSPPVSPPISPPVSPPISPPVSPPSTPPSTPPVVPPTVSRPDCEDGCEPRVEEASIDVQMFLVWAGNVAISGAFQFSADDVADALARFEKWKVIADIGEFVEGFAGSGGDLVSGHVGIDAFLNVATEGSNQWNPFEWGNPIDLQGMAEDSTIDALKKLIAKVNPLRTLGTWTMSCPLVRVHVTCTRTYECRGGYWVLIAHQFVVAYGEKIRDVTSPPRDNWDHDNPGRGAVETRSWLYRYFSNQNRAALQKIAQMAKLCAAAK